MEKKKDLIIVTGSSGLIGSATAKRLTETYKVVGFDNKEPEETSGKFFKVDITSDNSVQNGLEQVGKEHGTSIASVIHLAAYYDFSGEPSPKYEEITVRGTERLLRGLKDFHVEQFIFSSTMLVHAPCEPGERINEDWPLGPKWDYPAIEDRY